MTRLQSTKCSSFWFPQRQLQFVKRRTKVTGIAEVLEKNGALTHYFRFPCLSQAVNRKGKGEPIIGYGYLFSRVLGPEGWILTGAVLNPVSNEAVPQVSARHLNRQYMSRTHTKCREDAGA